LFASKRLNLRFGLKTAETLKNLKKRPKTLKNVKKRPKNIKKRSKTSKYGQNIEK